jgi:hypothetical protein
MCSARVGRPDCFLADRVERICRDAGVLTFSGLSDAFVAWQLR